LRRRGSALREWAQRTTYPLRIALVTRQNRLVKRENRSPLRSFLMPVCGRFPVDRKGNRLRRREGGVPQTLRAGKIPMFDKEILPAKRAGWRKPFSRIPCKRKKPSGFDSRKNFSPGPPKGRISRENFPFAPFLKSREFPFQSIARGSETPASREGQTADLDGVEKKACGGRGK